MCGIAGIYAYHYAANPVDRMELRKIRDQMAARGPDGFGEWYSSDERVGFGHRRAFGLWDAEKSALLLARDPYGIKPLYYADDGWTLRFASQVKALLAGGKVSREPEPAGWVGYCLFGSVPEPFTTYQEIRALPRPQPSWSTDCARPMPGSRPK